MVISYKHKFIFCHNCKVAGSSVTESLRPYGLVDPVPRLNNFNKKLEIKWLKNIVNRMCAVSPFFTNFRHHASAKEIKTLLPNSIWQSFFSFGFVRNPWSWQVSLYHFMLQKKDHFQHKLIKGFKNFDEYIEWRINDNGVLQRDFFYNKSQCLVDFIGKMENIDDDFAKVCNTIGIEAKLPHKNKSNHKPYQSYYNSHTRKLVTDYFKEDIELFNYKFQRS